MKKKLAIGNVLNVNTLKGLRFDSDQFSGIPDSLEVHIDDVKFFEAKNYTDAGDTVSLGYDDRVALTGRSLAFLTQLKTLEDSGQDVSLLVPNITDITVEYKSEGSKSEALERFKEKVNDELSHITFDKVTGAPEQVLSFTGLKIGVYPKYVKSGNYGAYKGLQLIIDNLDDVAVKRVEQITFDLDDDE